MENIIWIAIAIFGLYKAFLEPPISTFSVHDNRFDSNISEPFWRLLFDNFQISKRDIKALRFDGVYFHASRKIKVQDVTHLTLRKCGKVRVFNDTLPCSIRFRFSRIDGGPDRRHSNNWRIMESQKYIIRLHGKKSGAIRLFDLPNNSSVEPEALVAKVNKMLPILNHHSIRDQIVDFTEKKCNSLNIETKRSLLTRQRIEAMKIVNSYLELPDSVKENEIDLKEKHKEAKRAVESIDCCLKNLANSNNDS